MAPNRERGTLDLLVMVQAYGVEVVTYGGGFVGLKGSGLRAVPDALWRALDECEADLVRMVKRTPPPYRRGRGQRGA
jgi:hypothetical protein